ncbi:leucine-rich repeat-containing protein 74A-like [Dendronephthya gigantea]|uniref:leucine-rich repeat-containing protein 74A-like n=1 Tax=Dendronephthya gigantea TaxID=151771 RepID=UPI00106AE853|nr:leucine-rich repeat-containing protein 74A-like [Dendronephthya gigantea]XP_028396869.1 leucine-rich repeat-containing protein 74A-like [Dendronephthya gigantea]XP_028396870.1 leucine-rich repeat-containing protein 74A-like [Dendronephthya gigantea]XP_028396871.1 leucine-rich repeat-containing protein 74A-like [Dendronephthya gigantea]
MERMSTPIRSPTVADEKPLSRCSSAEVAKQKLKNTTSASQIRHQRSGILNRNETMAEDDEGWDTDLECEEMKEDYDLTGRTTYIQACKINGVIPVSFFLRNLQNPEVDMKHHGIGAAGSKPIAITLVTNTCVLSLNLADNSLGPEGVGFIADMLKENCYISSLDLSQNQLGCEGAKFVVEILAKNSVVTTLTLRANDFDDKCACILAEAIKETTALRHFDLSKNLFGEAGGQFLGAAIAANVGLSHLNLSWNHLRRKGAHSIANALKENTYLKVLNLSWNGFGDDGCYAMSEALKVNTTLEELDLTNNRISCAGAGCLAKVFGVNNTLKVLKLGKNPLQSAGATALLLALKNNPSCGITELELMDITVNQEFLTILKEIEESRPDIKISHGGSGGANEKPKERPTPMKILKNYIENNQMRLYDFFSMMDKDKSMSLSIQEFVNGLQETGISMNDSELLTLVESLDKDKDGEINYSELVLGSIEQKKEDRKQQLKDKAEEERRMKILTS